MASLGRREMLFGAAAAAVSACGPRSTMTASHTPDLDMKRLNREVGAIAQRLAPGVLGVGLMNLDSAEVFTFQGDRPFPMQGVFTAPLAAAALVEADAGRLSLDERTTLKPMDLSPPFSPVADAWPRRKDYSWRELLTATLRQGDNTAADVLMARIGGPGAVTAWLQSKEIRETRLDRYAREIEPEMLGLAPFRPAWKGQAAFQGALSTVPPAQVRAALVAWLKDPRDTATPRSALHFLHLLLEGDLVGAASRRMMLQTMTASAAGAGRLRAGLPNGAAFAGTAGTGPIAQGVVSAINEVGIATLPDGRRYAMAAFLSGATAPAPDCEAALSEIARALVRGAR